MTTAPRSGLSPATYLALALLSLALFLPGFFNLPPFDRDEARFAQASYQMGQSGNLIDIRFQDEARYKKPVAIYWLQTASTALLGGPDKEIWTYRVPSLLGAVAAVLLTAGLGAWMFSPAAGVLAGVMLASTVLLGVEARLAKTDAVLLVTILAAQSALARLYLGAEGRRAAIGFWVAAGLSVLVKGPLVALVSGATTGALALWGGGRGWLKRTRPLLGLAIVAAIALPWLVAIAIQSHGAFFAESLGHDMLGKVTSGQEAKGLPPGFYLLTSWVTLAPWTGLVLLAAPWAWANRRRPELRFCLAWIIPSWLVFEAVPTKLLHYTLPLFPALLLITAAAVTESLERLTARRRLFWLAAGLGLVGWGALAVAVALAPWLVDRRVDPLAAGLAPLAIGAFAIAVGRLGSGDGRGALLAGFGGAAMFTGLTFSVILPGIDGVWISRQAAQLVAATRPCPTSVVAAAGYTEPSLVFLVGTATRLGGGAAAAEHLRADPACALALVERREEAAFRTDFAEKGLAEGGVGPRELGRVEGFNYNSGRRIALTLYAVSAAGGRPD